MAEQRVLSLVLAGGAGKRLAPLTADRAKPAVPFGGLYRLVDFTLSNLVNAGCQRIYILTQYKSHSLDRHLTTTWRLNSLLDNYVTPVPAQQRIGPWWQTGSADAIYQSLNLIYDDRPDIVMVFGADHVYRMDPRQMIDQHLAWGAGATVAAVPVPRTEARHFGVVQAAPDGHSIEAFLEKSADPPGRPGQPDEAFASMGTYVFDTDVLVEALRKDATDDTSQHALGGNIMPMLVREHAAHVYDFRDNKVPGANARDLGYWRDVGTLDSYFGAHMDLCAAHPLFNLYNDRWPILTQVPSQPPAKFVHNDGDRVGRAINSTVSNGVIISGGLVRNSVLSPGARIDSWASVERSVLLHNTRVNRHAVVENAILDKNVIVLRGASVGVDKQHDRARGFVVSAGGVTVVRKGQLVTPLSPAGGAPSADPRQRSPPHAYSKGLGLLPRQARGGCVTAFAPPRPRRFQMRWMRWMRWRAAGGAAVPVPVIAGALAATAMAARLLLPVPVGMANNGDAVRLMCEIGANSQSPPRLTSAVFFVRFWYPFLRPGSGPPCLHYPTTQVLQMWLTAWVHQHVLGLPGVIDMRELIVEYCVLAGVVTAAAARLLAPLRLAARILILALLFLVLSEATFADYAASPFTETAALYGMLIFAIAGVAVAVAARGYHAAYLVAWASAVLAVGAKTETTTLALPLAVFLGAHRFPLGGGRGWTSGRLIPGLCVLSLAMTVYWSLSREPLNDVRANPGNELTMTIMPMVSDPGRVAAGLGLPRAFGRYSGTVWWSPHPIEKDPAYPRYASRFTQANLAHYLIGQPGLSARIFAGGAGPYLTFRNNYLGSYPMGSGHAPRSQECRDCLLMDVSRAMRWSGLAGVLAYWTACLAGAAVLVRSSRPGSRRRGFGLVGLVLTGCTMIQYVTAVYGEGNEVIKHMVIALFTASLAPVWLLAGALCKPPRAGPPPGPEGQDARPARQPAGCGSPEAGDVQPAGRCDGTGLVVPTRE